MNEIYKGKDVITGYYVYGPLSIIDGCPYINDVETGLVPVEADTVSLDSEKV